MNSLGGASSPTESSHRPEPPPRRGAEAIRCRPSEDQPVGMRPDGNRRYAARGNSGRSTPPPAALRSYSSITPVRLLRKARRVPSGDHTPAAVTAPPDAKREVLPLDRFVSQMST